MLFDSSEKPLWLDKFTDRDQLITNVRNNNDNFRLGLEIWT